MTERALDCAGYWWLLGLHKGLEHQPHSYVDVVVGHLVTQVHLCVGLRHSDNRLHMSHHDVHASTYRALLPQSHIKFADFFFLRFFDTRPYFFTSIRNIRSNEIERNLLFSVLGNWQPILSKKLSKLLLSSSVPEFAVDGVVSHMRV